MEQKYEIIQIDAETWRIEDGTVRCYLLVGADDALLIDTGMTLRNAREIAEGLTDKPVKLLNTHGDPDHIAGNGSFPSFYMHPDEEPNYRAFGGTGDFVPIRGGDVLDLGGRELEIVELPGHTPGSIAVLDRSRRALISGDPIQNGRIFMFGPARDLRQYLTSLRALQKRIGEFEAIWPAHGSFPISPDQIGKLAIAAERILARQVSWEPYDLHGMTVRAYNAGCATFLMQE